MAVAPDMGKSRRGDEQVESYKSTKDICETMSKAWECDEHVRMQFWNIVWRGAVCNSGSDGRPGKSNLVGQKWLNWTAFGWGTFDAVMVMHGIEAV